MQVIFFIIIFFLRPGHIFGAGAACCHSSPITEWRGSMRTERKTAIGPGAARRSEYLKTTKTGFGPSHYGNRRLRLANELMAAVNVDEVTECIQNKGFVFRHPVWPFASFRRLYTWGGWAGHLYRRSKRIGQNSANYLFQTSWLLECVSHHYNLLILGHN